MRSSHEAAAGSDLFQSRSFPSIQSRRNSLPVTGLNFPIEEFPALELDPMTA
jgi:hypothetical protein